MNSEQDKSKLQAAKTSAEHQHWMRQAIQQARAAGASGEVPVGAVLVAAGKIIGSGYNQPIGSHDPTAHAEIVALRAGSQSKQNYRLPATTLYVTIEPCTMCVGALVHARVELLVFGAREPRAGAIVSQANLLDEQHYNHKLSYVEGVLAEQCGELVKAFFQAKRGLG
jgi:tRNA(adenine34) deaminase